MSVRVSGYGLVITSVIAGVPGIFARIGYCAVATCRPAVATPSANAYHHIDDGGNQDYGDYYILKTDTH